MRELEKGGVHNRNGAWTSWRLNPEGPEPKRQLVLVSCPTCGQVAQLQHEIALDGLVSPSVQCPARCGFHENVRLKDWTDPQTVPQAGSGTD